MKLKSILSTVFGFIFLANPAFPFQNKNMDVILDKTEKNSKKINETSSF